MTNPHPAFLVLMQTTANGGKRWDDVGIVQLLEGQPGDTAWDIALDYATDKHPDHDEWRVQAWSAHEDQGERTTVLPEHLRSFTRHTVRAGRVRHQPRTSGPVFPVHSNLDDYRRSHIDDRLFGKRILITRDPRNCAGEPIPGTGWYPARLPEDAVSARVGGIGRLNLRGRQLRTLHTAVGEIRVPLGQNILVDHT